MNIWTKLVPQWLLKYRPWFIGTFQACLVLCSLFLAWLLRFDFSFPYRPVLLFAFPVLVLVRLGTMAYFGLFRGWWRFVGFKDSIDILKAVVTGSLLFCAIMRYISSATRFPRSIYVLEALLTT